MLEVFRAAFAVFGVVAVFLLATIAQAGEECIIKNPPVTGQKETGLLAIAEGVDEALGSGDAQRLAPYVQCKLTDGDKVLADVRLKTVARVVVLKSTGCKPGTRGIVLAPLLNCSTPSPKSSKKK